MIENKMLKEIIMDINWIDNFSIEVYIDGDEVIIAANSEGLESLSNILKDLSRKQIPTGNHIHLDQYNSLEEGSIELIIVKKE